MFEFSLAVRAYNRKIDRDYRFQAAMTRNMMACWTKNPPSVDRMMGGKSLIGMSGAEIAEHYKR